MPEMIMDAAESAFLARAVRAFLEERTIGEDEMLRLARTLRIELPADVVVLSYPSKQAHLRGTWTSKVILAATDVETKQPGYFSQEVGTDHPPTDREIATFVLEMLRHEVHEQLGLKPHEVPPPVCDRCAFDARTVEGSATYRCDSCGDEVCTECSDNLPSPGGIACTDCINELAIELYDAASSGERASERLSWSEMLEQFEDGHVPYEAQARLMIARGARVPRKEEEVEDHEATT